jgi:predicted AlkP superfamily phosphohydrolase/phosphomutase
MMRLFGRQPAVRVLVIGLDSAAPEIIFDQARHALPTLSALMARGVWGVLRSSVPPITVPAWSSMFSGTDPGTLGIYGFRNRTGWNYDDYAVADSTWVRQPRVWDLLPPQGRGALVMGVPQTYPVRPMHGHLVSGFLTPGRASAFTYPAILKQEVLNHVPDLEFDIRDFRTPDKTALLERIYHYTDRQYALALHLMASKPWELMIHVNMGTDRIQHAFWRHHDPSHRLFEAGNPFERAIRDYYRHVDGWIGRLVEAAGEDTAILVVSDHGVKCMDGALAINQWLLEHGWLKLLEEPRNGVQPFDPTLVDWAQTRAWSTGGYYGRIMFNVRGREPHGCIAPEDLPAARRDLIDGLSGLRTPDGSPLGIEAFEPGAVYRDVQGFPPDLIVYFGDLHWRTVGGVGYTGYWSLENDIGPDDANHAPEGIYILAHPDGGRAGQGAQHDIIDVAPTILAALGVKVPEAMYGRIINR